MVKEIDYPKQAWLFIEKYFPNYLSSDTIAYVDDLSKILAKNIRQGDGATKLLEDEFNGLNDPRITVEYKKAILRIYFRSVEGYIQKTGAPFVTLAAFILFYGAEEIDQEILINLPGYLISDANKSLLLSQTEFSDSELKVIDIYIRAFEIVFSNILLKEGNTF